MCLIKQVMLYNWSKRKCIFSTRAFSKQIIDEFQRISTELIPKCRNRPYMYVVVNQMLTSTKRRIDQTSHSTKPHSFSPKYHRTNC